MHNLLNKLIEKVMDDHSLGFGLAGLCWAIYIMKDVLEGSEEWL
jgi:hypothetical protein